jgi:hypothetical protein
MSKSRPQFAVAIIRCWSEFDCGFVSRCSKVVAMKYFASLSGAKAEMIREYKAGCEIDETHHVEIRSLRPGVVYDHRAHRWIPGLEWKPYFEPLRDEEEMPF